MVERRRSPDLAQYGFQYGRPSSQRFGRGPRLLEASIIATAPQRAPPGSHQSTAGNPATEAN